MATLKLKKFLNFYGSQPGNYDEETREWIASTPPDKLRRDLQKYRADVGVDFYNLDLGPVQYDQDKNMFLNGSVEGSDLREFYHKHIGGPLQIVEGTQISVSSEEIMLVAILRYAPQSIYKAILDKAIAGEEMTGDEISYIDKALAGGGSEQKYQEDKDRYILRRRVYFGPLGIIKALYEFVYDVSCQRVEVGRCTLEGCENIFVITPRGHTQKYCSKAHKMVEYRKRKKQMASV